MTPQTLRKERRRKFESILSMLGKLTQAEVEATAELLADAAESRTERAEHKTDETPEDYNVELFRGDFREYPEHLWEIAKTLRDVWMFRLPPKSKIKKEKGQYAMYCLMMDNVKQACGEFGADVLVKVHADWKAGFRGAIAPYTVAQPSSLVNPCSGKAREMRDSGRVEATPAKVYRAEDEPQKEYVPAPERKR